jgi:hypothetical protein
MEGVGPENQDFLDAEMATSKAFLDAEMAMGPPFQNQNH